MKNTLLIFVLFLSSYFVNSQSFLELSEQWIDQKLSKEQLLRKIPYNYKYLGSNDLNPNSSIFGKSVDEFPRIEVYFDKKDILSITIIHRDRPKIRSYFLREIPKMGYKQSQKVTVERNISNGMCMCENQEVYMYDKDERLYIRLSLKKDRDLLFFDISNEGFYSAYSFDE